MILLRCARLTLLWAAMLQPAGSLAQQREAHRAVSSTSVSMLLVRAAHLNANGKPDLAAQAWRQVLLADPENSSALEGLIRFYAHSGDGNDASATLRRLRGAHPENPELPNLQRTIASGPVTVSKQPDFPPTQDPILLRAEKASQQGDSSEAFQLYRSIFGEHPPQEWAIAYYQAQAALPGQRVAARMGLQHMAQQFPKDPTLAIALGRMLTLYPATRVQGTQILARFASSDIEADRALRQSLLWGASSPALAAEIAAYLAQHPDPPLAVAFAHAQSIKRNQAETSAAYRALQQKNIPIADQKFRQALLRNPKDTGAQAGMGFVALEQHDFPSAVHWLELAQFHGDHSSGVYRALRTARFWQRIAASRSAMADHNSQQAEAQVHMALDLEPNNSIAILAMAHLLADTGRQSDALPMFRELAERSADHRATQPGEAHSAEVTDEAWSGWLTSSATLRGSSTALAAYRRLPADMQAQLSGSPTFLGSLAQAYLAVDQTSQAEAVLYRAAQLPAAVLSRPQRTQILLQNAALCVQDRRYNQARAAYEDIVRASSGNPVDVSSAWQGLVLIEHLQGHDVTGLQLWKQMPPALRQISMQDIPFLLLVAGMQQSQKDFSAARTLLLQSQEQLQKNHEQPPLALLSQLAALDLEQHQPDAAISLYRSVLARDLDQVAAWTELLRAEHQAGEDREARYSERTMPEAVRVQLRGNPAYFQTYTTTYYQTMATVEQSLGNPQTALDWLERMNATARSRNMEIPLDMQLQEIWLQYDVHQDDAAQASLQRLQKRLSLSGCGTADQQNQMSELTANLAVREAGRMAKLGKRSQALQVLDTASNTAGNRTTPRLRLAAAYLTIGAPATAVAIYQSTGLQQATLGDRKAAIGSAMESRQRSLAQAWLQQGLADYPHNAGLLLLAAEFAESNGDGSLATTYLHAALARSSIPAAQSAYDGDDAPNLQGAAASTRRRQLMETDKIHRSAAQLLAAIQASHSGWVGGTGYTSHIVGTSGTTQLTDLEVPLEVSLPLGRRARLTTVLRTAYLDSGRFHGNPGQPLGSLTPGASAASPAATGVGGSLQIATRSVAASIGSAPAGFPVVNLTAAASLHPPHNPWALAFSRDSIRESQLSYAGLHDPAQPANVWGGAIANLGTVQYALGSSQSGWYVNAGGGLITGKHVASNTQVTGDAGAYWQIWSRGPSPAAKSLKLGINFYAQHNDHNELFFTYGHGGYFSPRYYLLPAVPITFSATPNARLHYELSGSLGPQILSQSSAPYFPLDPTLQATRGNPVYPAQFNVGLNYGVQGKVSYLRGKHWLLAAFFSASNASDYNQQTGGFSLRYLFQDQHVSKDHIARWFPYSGLRPYRAP